MKPAEALFLKMAFVNKIGSIIRQTSSKLQSLESSSTNFSIYPTIRSFSSSKLFVGGLSFATDDNSFREAFRPYGDVVEARIIFDRESGRSRGFGFISYASAEEASAAIQALDGRDLHGRFIRVAYAADQGGTNRGSRNSGSAGYGGSFRDNDGYGNVGSHSSSSYASRDGNYGASGSNDSYSGIGAGNLGGYNGSNYANANYGNGGTAYPAGTDDYPRNAGFNVGPVDNYRFQDASNGADDRYGHPADANFGGNHADGYAAGSGGRF